MRICLNLTRVISLLVLFLCFPLSSVYARSFSLPAENQSLLGEILYTSTENNDTPANIGQRYNIGLNAVIAANPGVTERAVLPGGTSIKVATQFLLPPLPRRGIVINLPEMRMYYYPPGSNEVMTFPIGIGRIGKTIPITNTAITRKVTNPIWIPPADIRKFNEEQGINLPKIMPAGPDNPLGPYAIYLRIPTYLIHSTIFPESIGRRASFGCIRMHEGDIKQFFPLVTPGTPVVIIDMPNKVAWNNNWLYLEAHEPLTEHSEADYASLNGIVSNIQGKLPRNHLTLIDWQLVAYLAEDPDGMPHQIGVRLN
ncbi:MAG: ErfK/YbiS/YcfS/YnhG family protein [uncultured bacterium]|nr:MAG: ErfK/YbiS/YcfS/YnhG family protein [uncultured bacterium]